MMNKEVDEITLEFRALSGFEPDALFRMVEYAQWPCAERDILFIQDSPDIDAFGIFAISKEDSKGKLIGTTTLNYCGAITFVGYCIVLQEYRNRGLGTRLIQHSIDLTNKAHLNRFGQFPRISGLTATELGAPVYRKLGFKDGTFSDGMMLPNEKVKGETFVNIQNQLTKEFGENVKITSFFLSDINSLTSTTLGNTTQPFRALNRLLWSATLRFNDESLQGSRAKLTQEFVAEGCIHILYDSIKAQRALEGDMNSYLSPQDIVLAWCAIRPGVSSMAGRLLAPLIARSAKQANALLTAALPLQLSLEKEHENVFQPIEKQQNFYLWGDFQATDGQEFKNELIEKGFNSFFRYLHMTYHVPGAKEVKVESDSIDHPKQYAMLDPGLG